MLMQGCNTGKGAVHIRIGWLSVLVILSEKMLYCTSCVFQLNVNVMLYYRWGCFPNYSRLIVNIWEIVRVTVIIRVEVTPYPLCYPESELKQYCNIGKGEFHVKAQWLLEIGKFSDSNLYHLHWVSGVKVEVMLYYRYGCLVYQSRVDVRVRELVKVKIIVTVILYILGLPCQSHSYTRLSHIQSKFYRFHKFELIWYNIDKFQ